MPFPIRFHKQAEQDLIETFIWYEIQRDGYGNLFFEEVNNSLNYIKDYPQSNQLINKKIRRGLTKKFPFAIYYSMDEKLPEITVIAILHCSRDRKILRERKK